MSNWSHQAWTTWVLFYVLVLSSLSRSVVAWTTIHVPNLRPLSSSSSSQTTRRIVHGRATPQSTRQFFVTSQLLALKKREDTATKETFKKFDSTRRNMILPSNLLRLLGTAMAVAGQVVAPCVAYDERQQQQPQPQIYTVNSSTPSPPSSAVTTDPFAVFGEQLLQDFNGRDATQPHPQQHWPYNAVSPLPPNSDAVQQQQQQQQQTSLTDMERALQKAKEQKQIDPRTHG